MLAERVNGVEIEELKVKMPCENVVASSAVFSLHTILKLFRMRCVRVCFLPRRRCSAGADVRVGPFECM